MLKEVIQEAAEAFSQAVMEAVQAHLKEVVGEALAGALDGDGGSSEPTPRPARGRPAKASKSSPKAKAKASKGGRLARRSPEEIGAAVAQVAKVLSKHPDGMRAEDIREATNLSPKELPRVLKQGVADKAFHISGGQKRSTTYSAGGRKAGGSRKAAPKAKKAARKASKAAGKGKAPKAKKAPKKAPKAKAKALNGAAEATPATA